MNIENTELNLSDVASTKKDKIKWVVFLLFFASGISGLVYEVVWSRILTYIFGATLYAVSTVLTAFMGGLALGSFLFGYKADKLKRPLRAYAMLEFGIGICGIFLPIVLKSMTPIYKLIYQNFHTSFFTFSLIRFAITFFVLLIPTTLMGATLPILSRFLVSKEKTLGLNIGLLYALNTGGAVIGCFLAGFFLIANLGMNGTIFFAAIINISVAIAALSMSGAVESDSETETDSQIKQKNNFPEKIEIVDNQNVYPKNVISFVLIAYLLSGFISMGYQIIWARSLVFTFDTLKNTTYSFTCILTVFLIGLTLGSMLISKFIDKQSNLLRLFALIEILIGISAVYSLFFILYQGANFNPLQELSDSGFDIYWSNAVFNLFAKTFIAIFLPTFMMGTTFPVVSKIFIINIKHLGEGVGKIYSVNTVGAIFGSFITGFFIIPAIGIAKGLLLFACANILIGLILILINPNIVKSAKRIYLTAAIILIAIILIKTPKQAVFQTVETGEKMLFYKEGPLATVSVKNNILNYNTLYVDNVGVAGTDLILLTDQKSLAHIPALFLKDPKSALTVGFGSGGASYSYLQYSYLERVDCVEISETVPLAADYLLDSNHGVLKSNDPRFNLIYDDARSYLKLADQKYDIIATDCTDLRYKSNANLYDLEYFELCREKITDDGMVVVWMPLAGLSDECFKVALRTFYKVFPNMSIWFMNNTPTHYILMLGTKSQFKIDYQMVADRLQIPSVKNDLAEIYLDDPMKILSCFITDESRLNDYLKESDLLNTENNPFLEFNSPKYGYGDKPMIDNLNGLFTVKVDVLDILTNLPKDENEKNKIVNTLRRYENSVPSIINGHKNYRLLNLFESCGDYMKASKIAPEDESIKFLLDYDDMKRRIERTNDLWTMEELGVIYYMQKRYSDALKYLKMAVNTDTSFINDSERLKLANEEKATAYYYIAKIYVDNSQSEKAIEPLKNALKINPDKQEYKELLTRIE